MPSMTWVVTGSRMTNSSGMRMGSKLHLEYHSKNGGWDSKWISLSDAFNDGASLTPLIPAR